MIRMIISAAAFLVGLIIKQFSNGGVLHSASVFVFVFAYFVVALDMIKETVESFKEKDFFNEVTLTVIASLGAIAIGEYPEAVLVVLLFNLGEYFEDLAEDKVRRSIAELMDIRPDYANLLTKEGPVKVSPDAVDVGDIILIRPGEKIPLDGSIVEGESMVDASALTGESVPRVVRPGTEVLSGCINQSGLITVKVSKEYGESTASRILKLVQEASDRKSRPEAFITRFSKVYTPVVLVLALLITTVVPAVLGEPFVKCFYKALTFLLISCPCALVISVPLSYLGGLGAASRIGVLVKGGNYLEALARTEAVVFDKTGTLTVGKFEVKEIHTFAGIGPDDVLKYAAYAENTSTHPIAASIRKAYGRDMASVPAKNVTEIAGYGIEAQVLGRKVLAGSYNLMIKSHVICDEIKTVGTVVYVALDGEAIGAIEIADSVKLGTAEAIKGLKEAGISKLIMLTGDNKVIADSIAKRLGLDESHAELLPGGKVTELQKIKSRTRGTTAFVGDGINDAPVLAVADVGIAMGTLGSDAAIEAADAVIMNDDISKISGVIKISRKATNIAVQNIVLALAVKLIVLAVSTFSHIPMWVALLSDVGVTIVCILNSMRNLIL